MDFSLLQTGSRHIALRDILALKSRWPYYSIMVVDPIIRFGWIFYAIFAHDRQHSTMVSFLIALFEVIRRGLWSIFRVENEHCANVSQYKASRDVPLPYRIEPLLDHASSDMSPTISSQDQPSATLPKPQRSATLPPQPQEPEQGGITASTTAVASTFGTLRRRTGAFSAWSLSKLLAEAHKQDFEKKRKTSTQMERKQEAGHAGTAYDDDDDDDDDDDLSDESNVMDIREAEESRRRGDPGGSSGLL